jgi:hypothetical protein
MHSLTSALDGGEFSDLHLSRFTAKGESPQYPLDTRLGGPQSRSGRVVEEKNSQLPPGTEPQSSDLPDCSQSLYVHSMSRHIFTPMFVVSAWNTSLSYKSALSY